MSADAKTPEPDLSGQTLDRYLLLRQLGVGGMGAVYQAEHTRLRKRFAVKLLRYEYAQNETFRKRFLREARAASAISHPNVVAISDFGETTDDHVFFVMELLGGRDLQALLDEEKKLPWPRTREILLQVTSALHAAHLQDIIHRDIKPSNVFLADVPGKQDEDFVKVLDFGIAKLSGSLGEATAKLTSTDEIFGTVAYMAPEMAMGTNDDRRSDVYAVGVMMYRMLTGELPYSQGNAFQILSQHIHAPVPPPRAKEPSISEEVEAILLRALAKSPDDRFASMEEMGRALRRGSLEATEGLVGVRTAMLVGQPKLPAGPDTGSIDRTTPLPAQGAPVVPHEATVVSSPIPVAPSDSAAAPVVPVPAAPSSPNAAYTPGSAAFDSSRVTTPAGSMPPPAITGPQATTRKRSPLWVAIPVLVVAGLAAGITMLVLDSREGAAEPGTLEASATPPRASEPTAGPTARMDVKAADAEQPPAPTPVEPQPAEPEQPPAGAEPIKEASPPAVEPEPPAAPQDAVRDASETKQATTPKPTKRPTSKPSKPKTDHEIVAALKAKLADKCKDAGTTKVRIEGVISSSGTVGSLLITPPDGLGACAKKIVSAAKFDASAGTRPMPRFSVEL